MLDKWGGYSVFFVPFMMGNRAGKHRSRTKGLSWGSNPWDDPFVIPYASATSNSSILIQTRTEALRGFDGNQDQQGKTYLSSRTRVWSLVLDVPLIYESWQLIFGYLSSFVMARLYHHQCHLPQGQRVMISFFKVASATNESVLGSECHHLPIFGSSGILFGRILR
jgi:hypothetical protein